MNEQELEPAIRRIVVALDASLHSLAALEAASELANALKAELVGVFVEDINLLRLAGLPFAREIRYLSALDRPLDSVAMERELRIQAQQVRRALEGAAARRQLRWSFRVMRGQVAAELLTAAQEADLLAIGRASWVSSRQVRLGSTARAVLSGTPRAVLLLQHGHAICQPVAVIYDASPGAQQALTAAVRLVPTTGGDLRVMVLADTPETAQRLEEAVEAQLRKRGIQGRLQRLMNPTAASLARVMRLTGGGTLVVCAENPLLQGDGLQTLLEAVDCSVLLVR